MYRGRTTTLSTFIRDLSLLVSHTRAQGATTAQQAFVIDQWHLRRDAATIQRNTCELRYLKQHNIKNLFLKLTWTLRICHFRRRKSTKTNRGWLTPWQQHVLQYTDNYVTCPADRKVWWSSPAIFRFTIFWFLFFHFLIFRFTKFWFLIFWFLVLQFFGFTIF